MLKFFYLATVIIPIAVEMTSGQELLAQSLYPPEVSSSVADTLVCYMQTSDGRLLQLESFCQREILTGAGHQSRYSNSTDQSLENGRNSNFSYPSDASRQSGEVSASNQDGGGSSEPSETAMCMPANAPECINVDFSSPVPDFVPDVSSAPAHQ